jgi:[ribosomal protein S18]-alanine N-acetyltransferase
VIRPGTPADAAAVVALETECLGADAWPENLVADGLGGEVPTVHYLVATSGDQVVGYAVVSVAGDIADLQRIAVGAANRRTGRASELLTAVAGLGRDAGADRLLLEVREDNSAALGFYAARGLVEIDRRPKYYRDGTTAVVMRLSLVKGCG